MLANRREKRKQPQKIDREGVSRAVRTFVMWRTNNPSLLLPTPFFILPNIRVCTLHFSDGQSATPYEERDRMSTSHQRLAQLVDVVSCRDPLITVLLSHYFRTFSWDTHTRQIRCFAPASNTCLSPK